MRSVGSLIEILKRGESFEERLSNPYLKEALDYDGILLTPSEAKERFPKIFGRDDRPIILEIGSYLGKNLIEMGTDYPDLNFIGLEITYKRAVLCARKVQRAQLENARVSLCEARDFLGNIPDGTLGGACVFFPDPWPKKKHAKNRLTHGEFFSRIQDKLVPGGFVWFKTDSEPYFEGTLDAARAAGWSELPGDQPESLTKRRYLTQFEELFMAKGQPIFRRVFGRPE